jgi:dTDP-4-amino-4,6-dideoxygalactose transaminase
MIDLRRADLLPEVAAAIQRVIDRQQFVGGKEVEGFEAEFAEYVGVKHGIAVNSGSDALFIAVAARGIGKGDEVLSVANTFPSTVDAIVRNGAKPIFVDIDPETYTIDVTLMEKRITRNTKAIMPVHLYGHPAEMDVIREIAQKHKISIIDDASHAQGAEYHGSKVGSLSDISCFSLYPSKNLNAYGNAGMLLTNDEQVAGRARMLRNYGQRTRYEHVMIGVNSRMDEIQAAVLRVRLKALDRWNDARRRLASLYDQLLSGSGVVTPIEKENTKHVYHLYVIRSKNREKLRGSLERQGIQTQIHYPIPVHKQKSYESILRDVHLPVTEMVSSEVLSLPMHPWLTENELGSITDTIRSSGID